MPLDADLTLTNLEDGVPNLEDGADEFVSSLGARVRMARQQCGLSRRALSEKSGVSQRYLAQLETGNGNISVALLYKIARALGRAPGWLLAEDGGEDADLLRFAELFRNAQPRAKADALECLSSRPSARTMGRRICLIGLRGAGKSTLGKGLANDLNVPFVELNDLIETESGMAVAELIALYGQEGYRKLERRIVDRVHEEHSSIVLAVGGGIVSEPETFADLLEHFHTIWLKAAPQEHMDRVRKQGDERPMAGNPRAMEELKDILTSRDALYRQAHSIVDTGGRSVEESRKDVLNAARALTASFGSTPAT